MIETEEDVVVAVKKIKPTPMPVVPIYNSPFDEAIPEDDHEHEHEKEKTSPKEKVPAGESDDTEAPEQK